MGSGALPDAVEALQRTGEERRVLAGARICFQWAPGEWYLGTVTSATSTPAWWRLSWDLGSSNQVLLGDANRNQWFVVRDARDNKMLEGMLREQQLADEEHESPPAPAPHKRRQTAQGPDLEPMQGEEVPASPVGGPTIESEVVRLLVWLALFPAGVFLCLEMCVRSVIRGRLRGACRLGTHTQRETHTDRHTHSQTDRQTDRQTDTHTHGIDSLHFPLYFLFCCARIYVAVHARV